MKQLLNDLVNNAFEKNAINKVECDRLNTLLNLLNDDTILTLLKVINFKLEDAQK